MRATGNEPLQQSYELQGIEVAALVDMVSLLADLNHAIQLCVLLQESNLDDHVRVALYESVVMAYGRCFQSGRGLLKGQGRRRLGEEDLACLTEEERAVHDRAIVDRNHHLAHRVGTHGQHVFVYVTGIDPGDSHLSIITAVQTRAEALTELLGPAGKLHDQLEAERQAEMSRLMDLLVDDRLD